MGQSSSIHVQLEKPVYYSGETIRGTAVAHAADKHIEVDSVILRLVGEERTHWSEQRGSGKHRHTVHFHGHVPVINTRMVMLGKGQLPVGFHSFPFEVTLPRELPSSWRWAAGSTHGTIAYHLQAEVQVPGVFTRNVRSELLFFQVVHSQPPPACAPLREVATVPLTTCCCCSKGALTAGLATAANVLLPNTSLPLTCDVDNNASRVPVREVRVTLVRHVTLRANSGRTRTFNSFVSTVVVDKTLVPPGTDKRGMHAMLPVPQTAQTSLSTHLIACYYTITMAAVTAAACTNNLSLATQAIVAAPHGAGAVPLAVDHPVAMAPSPQPPPNFLPQIWPASSQSLDDPSLRFNGPAADGGAHWGDHPDSKPSAPPLAFNTAAVAPYRV